MNASSAQVAMPDYKTDVHKKVQILDDCCGLGDALSLLTNSTESWKKAVPRVQSMSIDFP